MTQAEALTILKTGANVYLTGEPGSGKSYTIGRYVEYLRDHEIEPAVTASTGIAATHIHGMTVHAWSGIGINKHLSDYDVDRIATNEYVARRIGKTKVLIIDEISMLDSTTLDLVDRVCREVKRSEEPFGGIQTILVGDFFQLPPVSKDESVQFAFMADSWKALNPVVCYLHEQHRQDDEKLLNLLSALRADKIAEHHSDYLTERITHFDDIPEDIPKLFPHNADVDRLNDYALEQLQTDSHVYRMESEGAPALVASLVRSCLSPESLKLKIGAVVMFTKNNPSLGFANGTLGTVTGFDSYGSNPIVETRNGRTIIVEPMEWAIEENGKVRARIVQIPLRLAWAMTIHKSQGVSLDAAVIDLSASFEYGQGYVALSRVRTLPGLYLLGWNEKSLMVHPEILEKDSEFRALSDAAETAFGQLSQPEIQTMEENFILASGGVLKVNHLRANEILSFHCDKCFHSFSLEWRLHEERCLFTWLIARLVARHIDAIVIAVWPVHRDIGPCVHARRRFHLTSIGINGDGNNHVLSSLRNRHGSFALPIGSGLHGLLRDERVLRFILFVEIAIHSFLLHSVPHA
jgi:hypothetical protein